MLISKPISPVTFLEPLSKSASTKPNDSAGDSFEKVLGQALSQVNDLQLQSQDVNSKLAMGQMEYLHQATIAAEKASLALDLTVQVRNRVVEAYQEIMRMQM